MSGRLDQLCFLPPRAGTPWSGPPTDTASQEIARPDGTKVQIDLPLFWYDPPWHHVNAETADLIATAGSQLGVMVSAMRSDLAGPDRDPVLHTSHLLNDDGEENESDDDNGQPLPRVVPYRHERYGLSDFDFDGARVIDVRLAAARDETGRFAYSPQQIERWEATLSNEPLAGGGWVAAGTFLPDVASLSTLSAKLEQLRVLSPTAAVFVSVDAYRLGNEFPEIIANQPDGLIIRMDDLNLSGLQLALLTQRIRKLVDRTHAGFPLWIVPGSITPEDAAKLIAIGASAVAIDSWGARILDEAENPVDESVSSRLGYSATSRVRRNQVYQLVDDALAANVNRTLGLVHSMHYVAADQQLGCISRSWAKALGIPPMSGIGELIE